MSCRRLIGWLNFGVAAVAKKGKSNEMAGGGASASTRKRQAGWSHPAECFKTPRRLRELTAAVTLLYCILDDTSSPLWEWDCPCHSLGSLCPGGRQPSQDSHIFWNQTFLHSIPPAPKRGTAPGRHTAKCVDTPRKMYATSSKSKVFVRFIKGWETLKKIQQEQRAKTEWSKAQGIHPSFFWVSFIYFLPSPYPFMPLQLHRPICPLVLCSYFIPCNRLSPEASASG